MAARRPGSGLQLIAGGFGKAYVYETPFSRLSAYRRAEATGRRLARSVWNCGQAPQPVVTPGGQCDPNYTGYCVPPYDQGDVDCADIPVTCGWSAGPAPLDGDGDGYGCE